MLHSRQGDPSSADKGYVLYAHDPSAGPVTAIKNIIIQSSLAQLQNAGYYERYVKVVDAGALEELLSNLGPVWIPIRLADAHYRACDALQLSESELTAIGSRVGDRLQETTLITSAKKSPQPDLDLWTEIGAMHRVWGRLHSGGSVQGTKLGPKELLVELRGFTLNRYRYYRHASLSAMGASFAALNVRIKSLKITRYDEAKDETDIRIAWL